LSRVFIEIDDTHLINNVVSVVFYIQICFSLIFVFGTKLIDSRNNLYNSLNVTFPQRSLH